jgi:glutamate-1-semialdehyde 2,1-aminomutase
MTMGVPDSPGVTEGVAKDTLTAPFNNLQAVQELVDANKNSIAAIIIEPVPGNMGLVLPKQGFLEGLRKICDKENIVLIFDEVMTGFRLAMGGAQEVFGVKPDLTTLGKIIGGGMPVGAYGGKKEIMDQVSPAGPVYQAGTLSGNPIAMSAGLAMLRYLKEHPEVYTQLNTVTTSIIEGIKAENKKMGRNFTVNHIGSMFTLFFTEEEVIDLETAKKSDLSLFAKYFQGMLEKGVYLAPSQYESLFVSTSIDAKISSEIVKAYGEVMKELSVQV